MPVAILLDADVPPAVASALSKLGYDALAASGNPSLEALNDIELLREATRQGRVLVTFNIADFSEAARILAHTQEDHAGIVLIHSRSFPRTNVGAIARALDTLLRPRQTLVNSVPYLH